MKRYISSVFMLLAVAFGLSAQGVNFAITLTDDEGNLQSETDAVLRLSLVTEQADGAVCYVETHNVRSNAYGVVHTTLGEGTPVAGDWNQIDWRIDPMYLRVERAANISDEFNLLSTMRLGAVPYAYHARTAERIALTSPNGTVWNVGVDDAGHTFAAKGAPADAPQYGDVNYIFDLAAVSTLTIEVSTEEWNQLLRNYDMNSQNEECVHADLYFNKYGEVHQLCDVGLRLRGNTSRVRPEGLSGQMHQEGRTLCHPHFGFRLQKYVKDDAHLLSGTDRFNLRWPKDDPTFIHEVYGYDLMRRFGVYTTARSSFCAVYIKIKEDANPVYMGISEMFECYDDQYLNDHVACGDFASASGFMWKGSWGSGIGANFKEAADWAMGIENVTLDPNESQSFTYDYKSKKKLLDTAKEQLVDFITQLNNLHGDEFRAWAEEHIDIDLLLRAMACEFAIGHWDNFWANGNNFYIYFDNDGDGKLRYIPYDLDNTLGTGNMFDPGTQSPFNWGDSPLATKVLDVAEWRAQFIDYIYELADGEDFINPEASARRIRGWYDLIGEYVHNDTGEYSEISDRPAGWGQYDWYRILSNDDNNFFRRKINTIHSIQR